MSTIEAPLLILEPLTMDEAYRSRPVANKLNGTGHRGGGYKPLTTEMAS